MHDYARRVFFGNRIYNYISCFLTGCPLHFQLCFRRSVYARDTGDLRDSKTTIITSRTEPDKHVLRILVDAFHSTNQAAPFSRISLVDTNRVNPEHRRRLRLAKVLEKRV